MNIEELVGMEDITFRDISYNEFIETYSSFLVRTEVQGIQVALIQEHGKKSIYRIAVICDDKELYSDFYEDSWDLAYEDYVQQIHFVRNFFTQSGRRELFYYQDREGKVLSLMFA